MTISKGLTNLRPVHRSRPDLPFELTSQQCATLSNLYLKTDWGIVDCLSEVLGIEGFEVVAQGSIELDLPAGKCRVVDIDAQICTKEAMNRDHDRITVWHLQEIKKKLG